MNKDLSYYRRRTADEKAAAEAAQDSRAKAVHIELARRYDEWCARLQNQSGSEPGMHAPSESEMKLRVG